MTKLEQKAGEWLACAWLLFWAGGIGHWLHALQGRCGGTARALGAAKPSRMTRAAPVEADRSQDRMR